jgi:putative transposase
MLKAYKTELDPNNKQRGYFAQCAGATRYVYNWGLAEWKRQYEAEEKPSADKLRKQFNTQKDELCPWIRGLPYAIVEAAFLNLGLAFKNFFRRVRNGEKPGYPKFKKRGARRSGFQLRGYKTETDRVWLGKRIGWVRLKERGYIPTDVSYQNNGGVYATISERARRWYISILVEEPDMEPVNGSGVIGVDVGIKALAACSDGTIFANPKALHKYKRKLKRLQRELSRRQKGSKNWHKTKARIAKAHQQIANVRKHALHQVSHYVTQELAPQTIVIEDLNVNGMVKNHHLAQAVADASMSELHRQIGYKADWMDIKVIKADRWYASSKTCSSCGSVKEKLSLSERTFTCPDCGLEIDRDLNAARNLAALGIEPSNGRGLPTELG